MEITISDLPPFCQTKNLVLELAFENKALNDRSVPMAAPSIVRPRNGLDLWTMTFAMRSWGKAFGETFAVAKVPLSNSH
ncbi:hypothetical protein [Ruegeria halocynthiae]|uniref:hypothetical protein n=1 Tax=Ruegeria halocynthiae TaxID=985054 RepID=UPI00115FF6E5|nr:hypothetical protein [Ruegeria halocynthiae]